VSEDIIPTLEKAVWWGKLDCMFALNHFFPEQFRRGAVRKTEEETDNSLFEIYTLEDIDNIQSNQKSLALLSWEDSTHPSEYEPVLSQNRFPNVSLLYIGADQDEDATPGDLILALVRSCPNLRTLRHRDGRVSSSELFKAIFSSCKKLEYVSIEEWQLSGSDKNVIANNCPNLKFFHLPNSSISHQSAKYLLNHTPNLQIILANGELFVKSSVTFAEIADYFADVDYSYFRKLFNRLFIY
jgi:hypothetical protein